MCKFLTLIIDVMKTKALSLLFIILSMLHIDATASSKVSIRGIVIEKENGNALSYATICLADADNKTICGTTSSDDGAFVLSTDAAGNFILKVSFIGFLDTIIPITLENSITSIDVGKIPLISSQSNLTSAVVTAKVPVIEQKLDKIVMNVSESVATQGSNALEVLRKAPGVSVDPSGNILLNGNSVQVWIDGRPSNLSGEELQILLSGTDGSSIDKIEIIAHPSAKYDASGSGGIINIKTKKNFAKGLNGSLKGSYNISPNDKPLNQTNGALSLSYRNDKSNTSINYSADYKESYEKITSSTIFGENRALKGNTGSNWINSNNLIRINRDQFLDKKNIAGFVINAMKSNTKSNLGTNTWNKLYINGDLANTTTTRNDGKDSYGYINANLNYTHIIRDGDEFTINADWGNYDIDKDADQKNTSISPDGGILDRHRFRTNSEQGINIYSLRVDHQQKILGKLIGEAGFKWARSITDNNLLMENLIDGFWQKDNGQSSLFSYNEDITALYATLAGQAGTKWNFKGGLRAEHTSSKGEWISAGTSTSANYIDLFPTLFAGYNPTADLRLGLSYSTRIKRPNFRQMNPFRMYIDASSSIEGNPELTPEKTNTFSLSAGYKNHFNLALTGQFTKNVIIQSPFIDTQSGERIIKWDNFGKQSFAGASISASEYPLSSWLTFNGNLFIAQVSNMSEEYKNESLFSNGYFNLTFMLPKDYKAELTGFYQSGIPYGKFDIDPTGQIDAGIKKNFAQNKAQISLMFYDIFKTLSTTAKYSEPDGTEYIFENKFSNQRIALSFTFRFGQGKAYRSRKVGNLEEASRVGTQN